jgi:hypothetical protein
MKPSTSSIAHTMAASTKKRTLDAFFKPPPKKIRVSEDVGGNEAETINPKEDISDVSLLSVTVGRTI